MKERCATDVKPLPWYQWNRFPLVPVIRIRKADKWNTWSCHVSWLCFNFWTKDTPFIKVELELNDRDLVLRVEPPYLHGGFLFHYSPRGSLINCGENQRDV